MGIKVRLPNATGWVVHPKIEDLRVEVEKPTVAESLDFNERRKNYLRVEAAIHPDTRKPIYKAGVLQTVTIELPIPFDVTSEQILPHIKSVQGLEDLQWSPATGKEILRRFLEPDLVFEEEKDEPVLDDDGKPTGQVERRTVKTAFYTHLIREMWEAKTYARPLESPIPSSDTATAG